MSIAKTLIKKEIARHIRAIHGRKNYVSDVNDLLTDKELKKSDKDDLNNAIKNAKIAITESEKSIEELKADLKKL